MKRHRPLKLVKQKNKSSGCGIACLAMLARKKYDYVQNKIFPRKKINFYTKCYHLKKALKELEISHAKKVKYVREWEEITSTSIVRIGSKNPWHWIVYDASKKKILDPLEDHSENLSNYKKKPFYCLEVYIKS